MQDDNDTTGSRDRGQTGARRRLAAILHADVAGYSRLMGEDEAGTHARLMQARARIDPEIAARNGHVAGRAGDAVLAVFDSVVDALQAALSIQNQMAELNAPLDADKRLAFRIGINLGDVIADGGDVFGEGVNVAARIEALAQPGGITVTGTVRDQVGERVPVGFVDLGRHNLKNIAAPVQVFAVTTDGTSKVPRKSVGRRRLALVCGALAAVLALGLGWPMLQGLITPTPSTPMQHAAAPGDERPVIAVLPFEARGQAIDPYFAIGTTEDVIGALGRFSGLVVLSLNATTAHADTTPEALGRDLAARYLVSGSIQGDGARIRVGVQLEDTTTGALVWSERYDETLADVFEVQDRITRDIVRALAVRVTEIEGARAFAAPTANLGAYDLVLRGREAFRRTERAANVEARDLFERAVALDPDYADAHVELGNSHLMDFMFGWTPWPDRSVAAARAAADRAVVLDPQNAGAHALRADVLKFMGDLAGAEREIDLALSLNPNDAHAHGIRASLMAFQNRASEAVAAAETALRIDPRPRSDWLLSLMHGLLLEGRPEDVRATAARFATEIGEAPAHLAVLAAAQAATGDEDLARQTAARVKRSAPFFNIEALVGALGGPERNAALIEGLQRAGLD